MLPPSGLESSQLIIGIDYTKSNQWQGQRTFGNRCLHDMSGPPNPYVMAITAIGRTLEEFDDDKYIQAYGFGDTTTGSRAVFTMRPDGVPCRGFQEVLATYASVTPTVQLYGPTSFAPIINEATRVVAATGGEYHILLIVADGQVAQNCEAETIQAIVNASRYPLSIVMVGVGDGPWDDMERFDDAIPHRPWDNFQFVNFEKSVTMRGGSCEYVPPEAEAQFALDALMEVPDQYRTVSQLGYMRSCPSAAAGPAQVLPPPGVAPAVPPGMAPGTAPHMVPGAMPGGPPPAVSM